MPSISATSMPRLFSVSEMPGPGVDQVVAALVHDDAAHALAAHVPAVALAAVHHAEVLGLDAVLPEGVGRLVALGGLQVEVDLGGPSLVAELEAVERDAPHGDAVGDLDRLVGDDAAVEQLLGRPDPAEREAELDRQVALGFLPVEAGGHQLLEGASP
jgi:hypothetical protein